MLTDSNESLPLFAFDVDVLLDAPLPKWRVFGNFINKGNLPNIDAEYMSIQLMRSASVVVLSQYNDWQNKMLEEILEFAAYNYIIPCRTKYEFELFRDRFFPHKIISNIPKRLWQGEYSDVFEYDAKKWQSVFNLIREEIKF